MTQSITINLSDRLYEQLRRAAELAHQPVEVIISQSKRLCRSFAKTTWEPLIHKLTPSHPSSTLDSRVGLNTSPGVKMVPK